MSETVVPINPQPITAWQISTATAADTVEAINAAAVLGWVATITAAVPANSNGAPVWTVNIRCATTGQTLVANNTDWLVSDGVHLDKLTNDEFTATYTAAQ